MAIASIRLQNFRSYKDESFEFDPGVNIIVGPNASGKTNLLEAILVTCLGKSYRARDHELVRFNRPWARLDAQAKTVRTVKLVRTPTPKTVTKSLNIDDHSFTRLTLARTVPTVLFEPQHLLLLSGSPELRRQFVDDLLEQTVPGFGNTRRHYKRTLAQRNALLKNSNAATESLFAWNIRLSELGGQIAAHRLELFAKLNQNISQVYSEIAGVKATAKALYQGSCRPDQYAGDMLHKLELATNQDRERGFTTIGPHRDDMVITLNRHSIQETASRGEMRTLLLVLKIIELQLLSLARGQSPILLLDDVFSELDGKRRRALTHFLQPYQTFITTTDADVVVRHFMQNCHIIPL